MGRRNDRLVVNMPFLMAIFILTVVVSSGTRAIRRIIYAITLNVRVQEVK